MERKDKKLMLIVYYGFHSLPGYQGFQHGPSVVMQQVDLVLPTHTHTSLSKEVQYIGGCDSGGIYLPHVYFHARW